MLAATAEIINESLACAETTLKGINLGGKQTTAHIAESQGRKYSHGQVRAKDSDHSDVPDASVKANCRLLIDVGLNINLDAESLILIRTMHRISPRPSSPDDF
ncbi:hypothetical protein [Caballeronia arvi]|uniref:hypothetical protein n=1 Tax=Caballeronia arvi TaxID=1777135 RepID=UPI00135A6C1C|nr:hypothetical protein [Caballeronia arvi]